MRRADRLLRAAADLTGAGLADPAYLVLRHLSDSPDLSASHRKAVAKLAKRVLVLLGHGDMLPAPARRLPANVVPFPQRATEPRTA